MAKITTVAEVKRLKLLAELTRGMGSNIYFDHPVQIEPPFNDFDYFNLSTADYFFLGIEEPIKFSPLDALFGRNKSIHKFSPIFYEHAPLKFIRILLSTKEQNNLLLAQQFLLALKDIISFEIIGNFEKIVLQIACPQNSLNQVISQLRNHYPDSEFNETDSDFFAELKIKRNTIITDYSLRTSHFYPIKTLANFSVDPLLVAVSALEELHKDQFGAIQILFSPVKNNWQQNIRVACRDEFSPNQPSVNDANSHYLIKSAEEKASQPMFSVIISILASDKQIKTNLEGFLNQFSTSINGFKELSEYPELAKRIDFFLKRGSPRYGILLNLDELSSVFHLPTSAHVSEKLETLTIKTAPTPKIVIDQEGIILGQTIHRGVKRTVVINNEYRNRHLYILGATRTGKSTLLGSLIRQDIEQGKGVAVIDPHGDLVKNEILPFIPRHRINDVIYFNPVDVQYPISFNILHTANQYEEELLCQDLIIIFKRMFADSWGARMENILRYSLYTLLESINKTLKDINNLLIDPEYRAKILYDIKNPDLRSFWEYDFMNLPRASIDPIKNKLSKFLLSPIIKNIICQRQNNLDFTDILNSGKIFLANLALGELGEENSHLLGALLASKIQLAAMSRATMPPEKRRDFYLYIDEFQNFLVSSFEKILSEAGKYRLNLILAHQFIKQIPEKTKDAILGNTGTIICFRVGYHDAQILSHELGNFTAQDLLNLERGQAIVRMGKAQHAFNLTTSPPPESPKVDYVDKIVQLSREKYAALPEPDIPAIEKGEEIPELQDYSNPEDFLILPESKLKKSYYQE